MKEAFTVGFTRMPITLITRKLYLKSFAQPVTVNESQCESQRSPSLIHNLKLMMRSPTKNLEGKLVMRI